MASTIVTALNEKQFREFYGNAIPIKKDGYETTENQEVTALTAFNCVEDIVVFAIKKFEGKKTCVMGWRFRWESIIDIQLKFNELVDPKTVCDFYIVGGNYVTTLGNNCLLDRIHTAIRDFFTNKNKIVEQYPNPNLNTQYSYVTANMQLNGKLTFCRHLGAVSEK